MDPRHTSILEVAPLALLVLARAATAQHRVVVQGDDVDPGTVERRDVLASIEVRPGHGLLADLELSMDPRKCWSASVTGASTSLHGASLRGPVDLLLSEHQERPRFEYAMGEDAAIRHFPSFRWECA